MSTRKNFGKLREVLEIPDLIGLQLDSYANFLQRDVRPEDRKRQGLQEVFMEIFPIESFDKQMSLEFVSYEVGSIDQQKNTVIDCIKDGKVYGAPLYVNFLLKIKGTEIPERVYMGDIPIMTDSGTFIINGAERVIISQVHRSPCCAVHHNIRIYFADDFINHCLVGNIQLNIGHGGNSRTVCHTAIFRCDVRANTLVATLVQFVHDIVTQLATDAGYQNFHIVTDFRTFSRSNSDIPGR